MSLIPKPEPPSVDDIETEAKALLEDLGIVAGRNLGAHLNTDDAVHDTAVKLAKQNKRLATVKEISEHTGISRYTIQTSLLRLSECGRMLHPRRGVWVPRVEG